MAHTEEKTKRLDFAANFICAQKEMEVFVDVVHI